MRKGMLTLVAALSMAALIAGGCAKKEVVKGEEAVVPKAESSKAETVKAESTKPSERIAPATGSSSLNNGKQESSADFGFQTVYFDYDKSDLTQAARDALSKNADVALKSRATAKIQIEGHCDERGSAEYNMALGERRAKSSMQYLITLGVKADRLSTISYGKEKPAVQGSDEAAWSKNRRAEFIVLK